MMEEYEIPFACMTFEAKNPNDIHLEDTGDDLGMTLKVGKMSFDFSHIKPDVKFKGVCLRFSEPDKTPEGKARGIIFYSNNAESMDRLITALMEARNQVFGFNVNNQN
jgi:hypothetical protein